jgi:hypothetical protein
MTQAKLDLNFTAKSPLIVSYGLGVDSTALLVGLRERDIVPDAITFADVGDEKKETYNFLPIINQWLQRVGFPQVTVVRYQPKTTKHLPAYSTLGESCLTNATLPSLAYGYGSCSMKWKIAPQHKWTQSWKPALEAWNADLKVQKMIGYDASPKDRKRYNLANQIESPFYNHTYPLIDWDWNRDECKNQIRKAGLPVPPKSACVFCPSTKGHELHTHRKEYLRLIVAIEARAKPFLTNIQGLWRNGSKGIRTGKPVPATMTEYIRSENLLSPETIDEIIAQTPYGRVRNAHSSPKNTIHNSPPMPDWHDFLEQFTEEDALDEIPGCGNCSRFSA